VGFKNGTDGNLNIAVDAVAAAMGAHHFLSVTKEGRTAIFSTSGNADCHIILRGGREPNYDAAHVDRAVQAMKSAGIQPSVMIDFSHANSAKIPERQVQVCTEVAKQIARGNGNIIGVMIESHLIAGRQDVQPDRELTFGQSITDACIGWEDTSPLLRELADAVEQRRRGAIETIAV
jgi:3-deoxy-7-phosphoheptulonate synthase